MTLIPCRRKEMRAQQPRPEFREWVQKYFQFNDQRDEIVQYSHIYRTLILKGALGSSSSRGLKLRANGLT